MSFKDSLRRMAEAGAAYNEAHALDVNFLPKGGAVKLSAGLVSARDNNFAGFGKAPAEEVEVELIEVGDSSRMTATRVVAGTLVAPGVGTLVGALAKKKTGNSALVLTHGKKTVEIPLSAKDIAGARAFVRNLNKTIERKAA